MDGSMFGSRITQSPVYDLGKAGTSLSNCFVIIN